MEQIFKKKHEVRTTREKEFFLRFIRDCIEYFKDLKLKFLDLLVDKFENVEFDEN
jgi:hypothetical protein